MAIQFEFISSDTVMGKSSEEKINIIMKSVRKDKILVLEEPLTPAEEKLLIMKTMTAITRDFPGIEVCSLGNTVDDLKSRVIKFLGGKTSGLTVVGPSNLVHQVKRDPNKLRFVAGK
ncbi:Uncharacterised protein [Candidatus Norongarragalina meridionalis]|nr:Uncharacterised protein [Candidatus Norongarragalina meridionalis]